MGLYEEIKNIRIKMGLTQKDFAKKIKISLIYLITLENADAGGSKTHRMPLPSEGILKRIARAAAREEDERAIIEKKLMCERANLSMSKELKLFIEKNKKIGENIASGAGGEMMPFDFINRLRNDFKATDGAIQGDISSREVEAVLNGEMILSRKQVVSLAMALRQSVEEYLLLADYMPDSIKNVIMKTGNNMEVFFRKLGELSPGKIDAMVDVIDKIYNMCWEEGGQKDGKSKN